MAADCTENGLFRGTDGSITSTAVLARAPKAQVTPTQIDRGFFRKARGFFRKNRGRSPRAGPKLCMLGWPACTAAVDQLTEPGAGFSHIVFMCTHI